uniref:hypothetical protein n=1 Tax=Algoriphagus sp. TaxID=1872435 RepID=UPI0025857E2C|nr:hypothetical protein [Algoriphagus sp.]
MDFIKKEFRNTIKWIGENSLVSLPNEIRPGIQTKFSHVFHHLPYGIIIKAATGMGATSCEIMSPRNSIIVEPLKVTAYNKSKFPRALFVGNPPVNTGLTAVTAKEITEYLQTPGVKKIFCVVDNLSALMSLIPSEMRSDFFLLLDESHAYQLDSGFRNVMHQAFEIYKKHPAHMRATVTATPLKFSDPELEQERVTTIEYDWPSEQNVVLLNTSNALKSLVEQIKAHFKSCPDKKLVVALNSVDDILKVKKEVLDNRHIRLESDDIKIMCSAKRRQDVGVDFYHELTTDILPGRLNFFTAAYFTGFDLIEVFSLITVINPRYPNLTLSAAQCNQVGGRARNGLHKHVILYEWLQEYYHEEKSAAELIKAAQDLESSFKCLSRTLDKNSILLTKKLKTLSSIIRTNSVCDRELLFWSEIDKTYKVAYLSIDSILEINRLHKHVFGKAAGFKSALIELGYDVFERFDEVENDKTIEKKSDWFESSLQKIRDVFASDAMNPNTFIFPEGGNGFERETLKVYKEYRGLIDVKHLGHLIVEVCSTKNGWKTALKSLKFELLFAAYSPVGNFNYGIKKHFSKGGIYTRADLLSKWSDLKTLEPDLGLLSEDPVYLFHRIFANVRSVKTKEGVKKYYVSPTRKIDPRIVKMYRDENSSYRFDTSEYVA